MPSSAADEIIKLIREGDYQYAQIFLEDASSQLIQEINISIDPQYKRIFEELLKKTTRQAETDDFLIQSQRSDRLPQPNQPNIVKPLENGQNESDSGSYHSDESGIRGQRGKKEIQILDLSYPYLPLIDRIIQGCVGFQQGAETAKLIHSKVQALFQVILQSKCLSSEVIQKMLTTIFSKQCEKYREFKIVYDQAKPSLQKIAAEQKPSPRKMNIVEEIGKEKTQIGTQREQRGEPNESDESIQNISTMEEREYFIILTSPMAAKLLAKHNKNRSTNFLRYGAKHLKHYFHLPQSANKDLLQLVSFLAHRFIVTTILGTIKSMNGQLKPLQPSQQLNMNELKRIANKWIEEYEISANAFLKNQSEQEQVEKSQQNVKPKKKGPKALISIAKEQFITEFAEGLYEGIIPKQRITEICQKMKKRSTTNLDKRLIGDQLWEKTKKYQKLWSIRSEAEQDPECKNEYALFLSRSQDKGGIQAWKRFLNRSVDQ